jgi:hypothetical protein
VAEVAPAGRLAREEMLGSVMVQLMAMAAAAAQLTVAVQGKMA